VKISVEMWISAEPQKCFDAARDIDLHQKSLAHTKEIAVDGRVSGLIELGESVTWRGRHLGVTQHFTSKITAFDPPRYFQDTMQRGAFRSFVHDHYFIAENGGTRMVDDLEFVAPLGVLGRVAEWLVLKKYLTRLLATRAEVIKRACEG